MVGGCGKSIGHVLIIVCRLNSLKLKVCSTKNMLYCCDIGFLSSEVVIGFWEAEKQWIMENVMFFKEANTQSRNLKISVLFSLAAPNAS